ncbi:MAG: BatA domain-containing protein [Planctomycetaceae bacterium]|nr:BatA domain-containing protein [Planctomycetaceae bacterium]
MNFFTPWIAEHFLNPSLFWPGVALIALPIIIHLLNRLRYRRVRFAAMEFLLASEQRSRRRILFEHLLLLLFRVLMVLLIALLIARLILDQGQLALFQGAKAHHVVLLDDSGSMRDRMGDETAFARAKAIVRRLAAEGARRPGTQRFTLLLMSQPDSTYSNLGERDLNEPFVEELTAKLDALECTHQRVDVLEGLEAARQRLADDPAAAQYLHVLSDFRNLDWNDSPAVGEALAALGEAGVSLSFIRALNEPHENLGITELTGAVEVAAAGIPVDLRVTVQNFGQREAEGVRLSVSVDGDRLPLNRVFATVPAGESVQTSFGVTFPTAGKHAVEVGLDADALELDNIRYLAIDVPQENDVLIVDGTLGRDEAQFIADALGANRSVTGYLPLVDSVEGMRRRDLGAFQSIYLVNVSELPPDALKAVQDFVAAGGGLIWFVGDTVRPAYYNETLYAGGEGLFPVPLAAAPRSLEHLDRVQGPDLIVEAHPVFSILSGQDNPFIDVVRVNHYYPVLKGDESDSTEFPGVKVVGRLRNREPVILEHTYGEGRVMTFLTSAGPAAGPDGTVWNDWANGLAAPSYAIMHLELQKHIARRDRAQPRRTVGEPIIERLDRRNYQEDVEIGMPDGEVLTIKAGAPSPEAAAGSAVATNLGESAADQWTAIFRETDRPGIYVVRRRDHQQQAEETWMAYNVPMEEGRLAIAEAASLQGLAGDEVTIAVQDGEAFDWMRSQPPGQDVRWWLLAGLLLLFIGEQALAYRLGYH